AADDDVKQVAGFFGTRADLVAVAHELGDVGMCRSAVKVFRRADLAYLAGPINSWMRRISARISRRSLASRLDSGSSISTSGGSMTMARAIATRCCWPPDSCPGNLSP